MPRQLPRALGALAIVACANTAQKAAPAEPQVIIETGALAGRVDTASGAVVFEGIPYATPPVGDLRWRPPRPLARWKGVRAANHLGHNCMQHRPYGYIDADAGAGKSEDCLYLNVWTPSTSGSHPVMVWIHGGGFFAGWGGLEFNNPGPLTKKGAIVVTLNYRLGAFGFMAHPALAAESPQHSSGNYGLLDQISALQWVRRNIDRFGGDPTRVTIFGESAGGMSVGSLIGSPLAKGLFQRAIMQSGTGTTLTQSRAEGEAHGVKLAEAAGVVGTDATALARLRALPADFILAAAVKMQPDSQTPILWPAIDGWVLPHPVDSAIVLGVGTLPPILVGSNRDEPEETFGAPSRSLARLVSARGVPAYVYLFTRVGDDSVSRRGGAYHGSEITFVFGRPQPLAAFMGHASYDSILADAMSSYWVAFATSADPNGPPSAGKLPHWPRYDPATDATMELGPQLVVRKLLRRATYDSLDAAARVQGQIRP